MSNNEILLNKELLGLLEQRKKAGEITKEHYEELKEKYEEKLNRAKEKLEEIGDTAQISSSGIFHQSKNNYNIAGSAKISGGKVRRNIKIAGSAKFDDDIDCLGFKVAGSAKVKGNITANEEIKIAGSFNCDGFVHVKEYLKVSGSATIKGETIGEGKIKISGSLKTEDKVQAIEKIDIKGSATVGGNILSKGLIEIGGKAEIMGDVITKDLVVEDKRGFISKKTGPNPLSFIEGRILAKSEVFIESTLVKGDIKGMKVVIGPYSEVEGTVHYVEELDVHETAKLKKDPIHISAKDLIL